MGDAELTIPSGSLDTDNSPICPICGVKSLECGHLALGARQRRALRFRTGRGKE